MPPPEDPLLAEAHSLLAELRERCDAPSLGEQPEELLIAGYATALRLESTRRRLRTLALELSQRELTLAAEEQRLRALLRELRARLAQERRAQPTIPRRSA